MDQLGIPDGSPAPRVRFSIPKSVLLRRAPMSPPARRAGRTAALLSEEIIPHFGAAYSSTFPDGLAEQPRVPDQSSFREATPGCCEPAILQKPTAPAIELPVLQPGLVAASRFFANRRLQSPL